jgi:hypothetical protein
MARSLHMSAFPCGISGVKTFMHLPLAPFCIPPEGIDTLVSLYHEHMSNSYRAYDPKTGLRAVNSDIVTLLHSMKGQIFAISCLS